MDNSKNSRLICILLPAVFLFTGASLQAQKTSAATGNWSAGATWVGGIVPAAGEDVVIASGHTVTLTATVDITTGNLTVTGTLALAGFNLTAGSLSGAGNIGSASGTPLLTVGSNGNSTSYSGVFSGTGARLTKEGTGTLTLSGANTYTGVTTISAGMLSIGDGGTTGSVAGNITNNSVLIFNRSNTLTFSGVISGSGILNMTGTGTLTLNGNNTYTGATTISAGTLQKANNTNNHIPDGSALSILSGATFDLNGRSETVGSLAGAGTVTSSTTGTLTLAAGGDNTSTTFSGVIQNGTATSVALTKQGTGTLTLNGNNTSTGATTISAGILSLGDGGTTGSVAGNITNSAALNFNRSNDLTFAGVISGTGTVTKQGTGTLTLTGANTYTGATTISAGTLSIGNGSTTGSIAGASIVNNAALMFNRSNDLTYAGVISGTGTLTKLGPGQLTLSGVNTYSGATAINGGTLFITADTGLGAVPGSATPGHLAFNGGILSFFNSITISINRGILLDAGGGTINLTGNAGQYDGIIAGTGRLTVSGANWLTLGGINTNTYSGGTTINIGATLRVANDTKLGAVPGSPTPGHLVFNGGTLLATSNFTLNANRGITLNAGGGFFTGSTVTYQGIIAGTGGLTVNGGSGLTLSGASANTYTGVTTVIGSTLNISADGKLGAEPGSATPGNIVLDGATLIASATFTLNANRGISLGTFDANGINVGSGATLTYPGIIAGAGTLSKGSSGTLILSGANTYTGATTVNAGTLAGAHANALRSTASVRVSGTLRSDVALTLPPLTLIGRMNCNGFNSTTGQLRLNTTWQTATGSWGSTTSGAVNQNDTYFNGATGVLNVVGGPMILEVVTTAPGQTVTLPLSGTVDAVVNWGDATTNTYTTDADVNKVYAAAGTYTITISGLLTQFGNGDNPDSGPGYANPDKITRVLNWGGTGLNSLFGAFQSTTNLVQLPGDFPPGVVNIGWMFASSNFNQPIGTWNVGNVQRMGHMFSNNTAFNQNIGAWDVSNVWDMRFMFLGATSFNNGGSSSIGNWNTASLSRPRGMFNGCVAFNHNLGNWDTTNFWDLLDLFAGAQLSHCNYNATLIGWASQSPDPIRSNSFNGGNSRYTAPGGANARTTLSGAPSNWVFTDGGLLDPSTWSLTSAPGTNSQTVAPGAPITNITYNFAGGDRAVFSGLPPGVTGSVSGGVATISGTPTVPGVYTYSVDGCNVLTGSITVDIALPIRLVSFTSQCEATNITLKWATASETNNDFFTIERALDGVSFETVGKVAGAGNSSQMRHYSFADTRRVNGRLYYRLKQTDFDGQFEYSTVILANCNEKRTEEFRFYPNPVTNELTIEAADHVNPVNFELINSRGEVVYKSRFVQKTTIETSLFVPGLHIIKVQSGSSLEFKKVIIQ